MVKIFAAVETEIYSFQAVCFFVFYINTVGAIWVKQSIEESKLLDWVSQILFKLRKRYVLSTWRFAFCVLWSKIVINPLKYPEKNGGF